MARDALEPANDLSTDELFSRVLDDLRVDDDSRLQHLVSLQVVLRKQ